LSANPLRVETWWADRSPTLWLARKLFDQHLRELRGQHVKAWILTGTEAGRGPDNEPLVRPGEPVAWIDDSVLVECEETIVAQRSDEWGGLSRSRDRIQSSGGPMNAHERIVSPWGDRTPFGPGSGGARLDRHLADGVDPEHVDRWVQSASMLHSNGDATDIAVRAGHIIRCSRPRRRLGRPGSTRSEGHVRLAGQQLATG
jgi:hypothetical protein